MRRNNVTIVLAEDDDGHATLIEKNLIRSGLQNTLIRVKDGLEALELIRGEGAHLNKPIPERILLILDINMPRMDGLEALRQIKQDSSLAMIPVIILTTTDDPREIEKCYREGCNLYVSKPVAYDAFVEVIRRLGLFLEVVHLPGGAVKTPE